MDLVLQHNFFCVDIFCNVGKKLPNCCFEIQLENHYFNPNHSNGSEFKIFFYQINMKYVTKIYPPPLPASTGYFETNRKKVNETCTHTHTQRKTKTKIKLGDEDVLSSNTWQFKSPNFCQRIGMQAFGLNTTLSFTF